MAELVELGSGTAAKTRVLLDAMHEAGTLWRYVPFDVDPSVVEKCAHELTDLYPGLPVHGVVGDFSRDLGSVPDGDRRLIAFLGSTIGNLMPAERASFLGDVRAMMGPGDRFLLGTDLLKDVSTLEAAYNDSAGVTAAFNLNVLRVLNRELGADFDLDAFHHEAHWNESRSFIEMRLVADSAQVVSIRALGDTTVRLDAGEWIRTEISTKFTREGITSELQAAGLAVHEQAGAVAVRERERGEGAERPHLAALVVVVGEVALGARPPRGVELLGELPVEPPEGLDVVLELVPPEHPVERDG